MQGVCVRSLPNRELGYARCCMVGKAVIQQQADKHRVAPLQNGVLPYYPKPPQGGLCVFWGHPEVFPGVSQREVSQVNDDNNDNYFLEPVGRFTKIEEDEEPIHPLWNEV